MKQELKNKWFIIIWHMVWYSISRMHVEWDIYDRLEEFKRLTEEANMTHGKIFFGATLQYHILEKHSHMDIQVQDQNQW